MNPLNRYTPERGIVIKPFAVVYAESVFKAVIINPSCIALIPPGGGEEPTIICTAQSGVSLNEQIAAPVVGLQLGDNAGAAVIAIPAPGVGIAAPGVSASRAFASRVTPSLIDLTVPSNLYIIPLVVFLTRLPGDTLIPET